ncbi:MAG: hypothetical protein M1827_005329 [Pycnora praestabilis]|nr:MAG: hypothetical protein M1827_005329 [Pycnora praestabilis]
MPHKTVDQDFGLLQAVDERLAMYGWLTNTGVKLVVVIDMAGRPAGEDGAGGKGMAAVGLRDADLKPVSGFSRLEWSKTRHGGLILALVQVFRALQTAYVRLLQNPFYVPDDHAPLSSNGEHGTGSTQITSRKFIGEVKRIADAWAPGVTNI